MLFKLWLLLLIVAMIASLSSGLYFLMSDIADNRKRTFYALAVRISIAVILITSIILGVTNEWITIGAPWDAR